jgi:glycine oxidase
MSKRSIVVIGGGVVGLTIARRLLREGAAVAVVDASATVPPATAAAAGMLAPAFEHGRGAMANPLFELGFAAFSRWPQFAQELEEETQIGIDLRRDGSLGLAFTAQQAAEFAAAAGTVLAAGGDVRLLNAEAARRREPAVSHRVVSALWAPLEAQVDARRLLVALRRAVKRAGGALFEARAEAVLSRHGAACGVRLATGEAVVCDAAVVAAGAAAAAIRAEAPSPPIFPVKGEAVIVRLNEPLLRGVVRAPGAYLCPKAEGLYIGATEKPCDATPAPDPAAIDALKAAAVAAVPAVRDCPEVERLSGLRPATPDGAPVIGCDPTGLRGLHFALGCLRNGILFAPEIAERLAPAVLGRGACRSLAPFAPERFAAPARLGDS